MAMPAEIISRIVWTQLKHNALPLFMLHHPIHSSQLGNLTRSSGIMPSNFDPAGPNDVRQSGTSCIYPDILESPSNRTVKPIAQRICENLGSVRNFLLLSVATVR